MQQYWFGSGIMWAIPLIDIAGNNVATPTPVPFGAMQDVSIDISHTVKELYGQNQYPLAIGRGTAKITGKAKQASIQASLFNQVYGANMIANQTLIAYQEAANIGGANNNATVSHNGNAVFLYDLGVFYAANGNQLARNTAPGGTGGQYSVDANGKYTFSANEANNTAVQISYAYVGGSGNYFVVQNQPLGISPFFKVALRGIYGGKQTVFTLYQCVGTKLTIATKLEDFVIPEFDFSAMADASGNVYDFHTAQ